ncbi:PIG-L deacetylase family protein [Rhabdothermincola salaria]|uniref:PIG-L deacetylase family protein n=1 Tax=Rhabdothermincola salaria TaxID=2903142 RepID=UPI001E3E7A5C|nr:PIG-L family deacetylase [Rhabdothermincola salaria]
MTARTLVAFHAHPDDEALLTAGTLARAVREGHRVVLVLATRGEVGTVAEGVLGGDEDLAALRSAEAGRSAAALGADLVFLGYADSGLASDTEGRWPEGSLCAAHVDEVAARLAEVLETEGADLLVADDRNGGYGHPDHRRVHEVAVRAAARTGVAFFEATIDREFLSGGIALAEQMGVEVPSGFVPPDVSSWYTPAAEITHAVDVAADLPAKRASMEAHASQTTGAPDTVRTLAVFLGLPDEIFALAFGTEWFVARGRPTEPRAPWLFPDPSEPGPS